jgi:hypothetical protein
MSPTALPRCYARRPRLALRSHDLQRESRKPSVHAATLCSPCAYHDTHCIAQVLRAEAAAYATLARSSTRITEAMRTCSRLVLALCSLCAHHVPPLFCPGRGVRYVRTIVSAHQVSEARMQSPCARLESFMSQTILPRRCARKPRRTLRSHDLQRASHKLSVHAVALCSPCAHHVPNYTAQALRASAVVFVSTFLIKQEKK